jgi:hypothetical protein
MERPTVQLSGQDGNVYSIIGRCREAAKKAQWLPTEWEAVKKEMMDGDYDHVLQTAMKYFEVE